MRTGLALFLSFSSVFSGLFAGGCASTSYVPMPSRSVRVVMKDDSVGFMKHGESLPMGFFGGGLVKAVGDVPAARREAETYRTRKIAGFATTMGSLGLLVGGLVGTYAVVLRSGTDDPTAAAIAGGTLLTTGLMGLIAGGGVSGSAEPHMLDAINIHNDAVETSLPARAPYPYAVPVEPAPPIQPALPPEHEPQ